MFVEREKETEKNNATQLMQRDSVHSSEWSSHQLLLGYCRTISTKWKYHFSNLDRSTHTKQFNHSKAEADPFRRLLLNIPHRFHLPRVVAENVNLLNIWKNISRSVGRVEKQPKGEGK